MTARSPAISVVLPVHGEAIHLPSALRSLRWQTWTDHETLLVDDGLSPDRRQWLRMGLPDHAGLRVICCEGRGLVDALNTGLRHARGDWIARMDGDDLCHPRRFEMQIAALAQTGIDVLGCEVRAFPRRQVTPGWRLYERWQNSLHSPAEHNRDAFVESPLCHPSVVMRRRLVLEHGGYRSGDFAEDYDLWLRLLAAGASLAKLDQALLLWRERPDRLTREDGRYRPEAFRRLKAFHLKARLDLGRRPFLIWGAGKEGKAMGRALASVDLRPRLYIDIDPRKIGGHIAGVEVVSAEPDATGVFPWQRFDGAIILVAVGTPGVRDTVRAELDALGLVELRDHIFVA